MGLSKLTSIAVTLAFLATATGRLPQILETVRMARIKLIKDSQASKWPKAMILPSR